MEITYTKQGDYYLPDLALPKTQNKANLGKYAILRLNYLKQNKKALYQAFLMKNELTKHLEEVDKVAKAKVEEMVNQMAREAKVDEKLKLEEQMKWVRNDE